MCHPTRCKKCGKTTWAGCGRHVARVKERVPASEWCAGHAPEVAGVPGDSADSWLRRLLGR